MKSNRYRIHPATLFFVLTLAVAIIVWLLDIYRVSVYNPGTKSLLVVQSLFEAEGIRWLLRNLIANFSSFAPIGMVVVSLMGLSIAETSGFLSAFALRIPRAKYTSEISLVIFIFLGLLSNVVGDAGYVFLIPLVMLLAPRLGIHPLFAIIVTFVSVACGYTANVVVSSMDPLLARISADVTKNFHPQNFSSGPFANYYFIIASTLLLTVLIYFIAIKLLKPQLAKQGALSAPYETKKLSQRERRSLRISLVFGISFLTIILWLTFAPIGLFRGVSGQLIRSPFIMGALLIISCTIGIMGLTYGLFMGKYRSDRNIIRGLGYFINEFSSFFVIAFFAAQFFACLSYTHLDQFVILYVGDWVSSCSLGKGWMLLIFIIYCSVVNLCMVSAVGKWTLIAPLFLPLFWEIGVAPDVVQAAFRTGESSTNVITPFLYYSPFIIVLLNRYVTNISFGYVLRVTWYFSLLILVGWTTLFFLWYYLKLPFGL